MLELTLQISLFGVTALAEPFIRWALRDVLDAALTGLRSTIGTQNPLTGGRGS